MPGIPSSILLANHIMFGVDPEKSFIPPAGGPPILPYAVCSPIGAGFLFTKLAKKTFCNNDIPAQQGTDIGFWIPHIGVLTNVLYPLVIFSKSKSVFGASTVLLESQPIAVACVIPAFNLNLNCGSPISSPTGCVIVSNTVLAGMTLGDFLAGIASMVFSMALDLVFKYVNDKIASKLMEKMFSRVLLAEGETFLVKLYTFLGSEFGEFYQKVAKEYIKKVVKTLETLGLKGLKPLFDPDKQAQKGGRAIGDSYFNDPSVPLFSGVPH